MPRRRLLAVAVAGLLALPALAACRDQPTVAAYVGATQLTNTQVEDIVATFPEATRQRVAGTVRTLVVSYFVSREIGHQIAREHSVTVPAADPAERRGRAELLGVPPDGDFIRLEGEAWAALRSVAAVVTPQAPTDADKHEIYDALVADRRVPPDQYDAYQNQLDAPETRAALGLRPVVRDALTRYHTSINPRYQPLYLRVFLGQTDAMLLVPVTPTGPPAVLDLKSTPCPPGSSC
jgi:hypothetical protein